MFENSLALVDDCGLTHLHVFPYSARPGTPAARIPPIEKAIVKARASALRSKGEAALTRFLASEVGQLRPVLIEKSGLGRTEQFTLVELPATLAAAPGEIMTARITGHTSRALIAEAA
jgi:threonylcarbamoyladenosine tRNA methylthiotransferase MtaB